ncbi:MAG: hypothetical protein ACI85N_001710 [Gammaproteobacteria bacterium]|jgi:hypothetical protein
MEWSEGNVMMKNEYFDSEKKLESDKELDEIWGQEVEKRLNAYRTGKLQGISLTEVFKEG